MGRAWLLDMLYACPPAPSVSAPMRSVNTDIRNNTIMSIGTLLLHYIKTLSGLAAKIKFRLSLKKLKNVTRGKFVDIFFQYKVTFVFLFFHRLTVYVCLVSKCCALLKALNSLFLDPLAFLQYLLPFKIYKVKYEHLWKRPCQRCLVTVNTVRYVLYLKSSRITRTW